MRSNVLCMKSISIYVSDEFAKKVERAAQADRRPVSAFIRLVLEDAVAERDAEAAPALVQQTRRSSSSVGRNA